MCLVHDAARRQGNRSLVCSAEKIETAIFRSRDKPTVQIMRLPKHFPPHDRAKLLFDLRQGLIFRAGAGIGADYIVADINRNVRCVIEHALKVGV